MAQWHTVCHCAMAKPTWACTLCGRGFGRKFSAKRHVDLVHQGLASYVRWSDYLIGRTRGIYPPGEPPHRGIPKRVPTYWERMMDAMHEGFHNEVGRILARQALSPTSYKLPKFAATSPYIGTPYLGGHIFAVGAYVCSNCLAVKPSILSYVEGDRGGQRHYWFFCPPSAARNPSEYGETKEEFMARAKKHCSEVLFPSIIAWIGTQLELIAVEIIDPNRFNGRITLLKTEGDKIFSITLDCLVDRCVKLDASKTGNWAIRAIRDGRTTLSLTELSEFLNMSETASYAFVQLATRKEIKTFLMTIAKSGANTALSLKEDNVRYPNQDVNNPTSASENAAKTNQ